MRLLSILLILLLCLTSDCFARGGGRGGGHYGGGGHRSSGYRSHSGKKSVSHSPRSYKNTVQKYRSTRAARVARDSRGRIKRSAAAKREFMSQTGYPNGRPGYVVDHILPLKRGGADAPSNMQWQTKAAAKAKDKWE